MSSIYLIFLVSLVRTNSAVQVETKYGTVEGLTEVLVDEHHAGIELNTFYSIPYAKPPVNDLRFEPPVEPNPFDEVFNANQLGAACEQNPQHVQLTHPGWDNFSEDCLHLSIYAPADQSAAPYPVMIWIHGGAYQAGANIMFAGHFLAAKGVVVVVPNYRLGVYGFAWSGDDVIPGNMGLMDQALAMRYVQENIAAFGGDPDMVTIFGESAGAASIGLQMMSPKTEGLFHQSILQSGSEYAFWAVNGPQHEPENYVKDVAEQMGCPSEDSTDMAECLRSKTVEEFEETNFTCSPGRFCFGFGPVVDGEGGFLPDVPVNLRMQGNFHKVPEIIGINRHEMFLDTLVPGMHNLSYAEFEELIRERVGERLPAFPDKDREEDVVQALLFYYSPWPHIHDRILLRNQYGELLTDSLFGASADQQVKDHQEYAHSYFFVYDYMAEGMLPEFVGTPHAMEIPFVFGSPFLRQNPEVQNQTGIRVIMPYRELDREYSYFVMTLWTNFVKYGSPTPDPVPAPGGHDPVTWDTYTSEELNYIYIGRDVLETAEDFRQQQYAFWRHYIGWLILGDPGAHSDVL